MPKAKPLIAFQGISGAYSGIAAQKLYPGCGKLYCPSFEAALLELDARRAERAVIPVTNALAGPVTNALAALRKGVYAVEKTLWLPVDHCLLALPGAKMEDLRAVYSHWQALEQCKKNIAKLKLKPVVAGDTAGAAKQVAEEKDTAKAAIASSAAAKEYGLSILRKSFQDLADNKTLFFALCLEKKGATPLEEALKKHGL